MAATLIILLILILSTFILESSDSDSAAPLPLKSKVVIDDKISKIIHQAARTWQVSRNPGITSSRQTELMDNVEGLLAGLSLVELQKAVSEEGQKHFTPSLTESFVREIQRIIDVKQKPSSGGGSSAAPVVFALGPVEPSLLVWLVVGAAILFFLLPRLMRSETKDYKPPQY